jgi:hypothetical protein
MNETIVTNSTSKILVLVNKHVDVALVIGISISGTVIFVMGIIVIWILFKKQFGTPKVSDIYEINDR